MGKITFYCTICAGPLDHCEQRKASLVQPGDDEGLCFDDTCECEYEAGENDDGKEEQNSEADLLKHDEYCQYRQGYWGDILSEDDISWLSKGRMLRLRLGDEEDETGLPDDGSLCYLTPIGFYDTYYGCIYIGEGDGLLPNQDGFLVHDACWKMLHMVHRTRRPTQRPLDLCRVYQAMHYRLGHQNDPYIDWGDSRLYGGTEQFAEQEWVPVPGYEWLVANPMKEIDLSELITKPSNLEPRSRNGHSTSGAVFTDPFATLPTEIHCMILELLPSNSVLSLFLSSRAFCGASTILPPAFWKSRIYHDTPWIEETSLQEALLTDSARAHHKPLFLSLKDASARPLDGRNTRYEIYLSLKNRRRIWTCCEGILDIIGLRNRDIGPVSSDLEALSNTRIASIREPTIRERGKLTASETYFRPAIQNPPIICGLMIYLSEKESISGIEWQLEGETSGRLFGNRATNMQKIALPIDLVITGILLSLGPASSTNTHRTVCGLGLLSQDETVHPRIKLGRWTEDDLVHVFRPAKNQRNETIVGIAGQYSDTDITKFGIITADLISKPVQTLAPPVKNMDIYTRWHSSNIPHPNEEIYVRHGIPGFPLPNLSPFDPPILMNPAVYVDLKNRQIASIQAFFLLGAKKEFGGFRFSFTDGHHQVVGIEANHESIYHGDIVVFDGGKNEAITKIICYFDSNVNRTAPTRFHGVEFCTSQDRILGLGWLDAYSEDYRRESCICGGEQVVGLHFGIKNPVIESIGLIVA